MTDSQEMYLSVYNGGERPSSSSYSRYWHGYLIFLKPLLTFLDYGSIRYLVMSVQLGLFVLLMLKIAKECKKMLLPTFLFWIFLNPVTTMLSLQYNTILIITFLAMLIILYANKYWQSEDGLYLWGILFLLFGTATSYFDLLTYPLVTLGVPLTLWLSLRLLPEFKDNIKNIIFLSFFWGIGYAGMWSLKWVIGSVISGTNIISEAGGSIRFRTSSAFEGMKITYNLVLEYQWAAAKNFIWEIALFGAVLYLFYKMVKLKKVEINSIVAYLLVAIMPFVWYFVLKNHSFAHNLFTFRELSVFLYAITSMCLTYGDKALLSGLTDNNLSEQRESFNG